MDIYNREGPSHYSVSYIIIILYVLCARSIRLDDGRCGGGGLIGDVHVQYNNNNNNNNNINFINVPIQYIIIILIICVTMYIIFEYRSHIIYRVIYASSGNPAEGAAEKRNSKCLKNRFGNLSLMVHNTRPYSTYVRLSSCTHTYTARI